MGCFSTIASRLLALLSLLSVCACAWPFPVELANTSFEQPDRNKPDVPLGYSTYASPGTTAKFLWDRETAHSGKASLSIINDGPATGLWAPANVPCVPGIRYRVRVWVKTENARGRSGVSVRFRDDKGWLGAPVLQPDAVSGTNDWTQLEYEVLTPGAATNFTSFSPTPKAKVDNCGLTTCRWKTTWMKCCERSYQQSAKSSQPRSLRWASRPCLHD